MKRRALVGAAGILGATTMVTVCLQAVWLTTGWRDGASGAGAVVWIPLAFWFGAVPWAPAIAASIIMAARKRIVWASLVSAAMLAGLFIISILTFETRPTGLEPGGEATWSIAAWLLITWISVGPLSLVALGLSIALGPIPTRADDTAVSATPPE